MVVYHEATRVAVYDNPMAGPDVETTVVEYRPKDACREFRSAYLIRTAVYVADAPPFIARVVESAEEVSVWKEDIALLPMAAAVRRAIRQHDETVGTVERIVQWTIEEYERQKGQPREAMA